MGLHLSGSSVAQVATAIDGPLDQFHASALTTAAVQAAVDAAAANGGGIVLLPPGSGTFTSAVNITSSGVRIRGAGKGRTIITAAFTSGGDARVAAFSFKGSIPVFASPTASLSVNASVMGNSVTYDTSRTITVDHTTGLAAKDVVMVGDNNTVYTWSNSGWTNRYRGEFARIESVTSTTITFETPLRDAYLTGNSAGAWKPTLLSNVGLYDLTVTCADQSTQDVGAVYFDLCQNAEVERVHANALGTWGFKADRCYGVRVHNVVANDLPDTGTVLGYGVIFQGTEAGRLSNSRFYRCRHAFTTGAPVGHVGWTRNTTVENCISTDMTNCGFDSHPWTTGLVFIGCRSERNANGGFTLRGQRSAVIGCATAYNENGGIYVSLQAAKKCVVQGNVLHADDNGVVLSGTTSDGAPSDTAVVNNEIIDARLPGISFDSNGSTVTNPRIQRNTITSPHRGGGSADTYTAMKVNSGTVTGAVLLDNHGVSCNRVIQIPTSMTGTIADGNRLTQATGTTPAAIQLASGASLASDSYSRLVDPGSGTTGQVFTRQSDGSNTWATAASSGSPGIVVPLISGNPRVDGVAGAAGNKSARGVRVRCPIAGTLRSFSWFVGVSSGNAIGWITDVGQASSGNYSKLWDSGSVAVGTVNLWQSLGDPSLVVTAGQELIFWVMFDNATAAYGRSTNPVTSALYETSTFPVPAGITDAILAFNTTLGTFAAPSTIAHSSGLAHSTPPQIIARLA